jgi:hypothetical protein
MINKKLIIIMSLAMLTNSMPRSGSCGITSHGIAVSATAGYGALTAADEPFKIFNGLVQKLYPLCQQISARIAVFDDNGMTVIIAAGLSGNLFKNAVNTCTKNLDLFSLSMFVNCDGGFHRHRMWGGGGGFVFILLMAYLVIISKKSDLPWNVFGFTRNCPA